MAKQISPVNVWVNGQVKVAEYLEVTGIYDNYQSAARNEWQIFTMNVDSEGVQSVGELVSKSNLDINGQDYINWGDQPAMAINEWIYDWVAEQLNLTII